MAYSTAVTYLLWASLGWLGVHHFYLRRDRHAFVWFWTLGGCCGVGWLCEIVKLCKYVRLANHEAQCAAGEALWVPPPPPKQPSVHLKRIVGELIFSCMMGAITIATFHELIPPGLHWWIEPILITGSVGIGVHTIADIGREQCSLKACFHGAAVPCIFHFLAPAHFHVQSILCYAALASTITANWYGVKWRVKQPTHRHVCTRLLMLSLANSLMFGLMVGAVYLNGSITNQYGERIPIREAFWNMLESPAWAEFRVNVKLLAKHLWYDGFEEFLHRLATVFDVEGEESAYQILNVASDASEKEIHRAYKQLALQYHPDKAKSDAEKKTAEEKFVKIGQAYERLSTLKSKRRRKNEL